MPGFDRTPSIAAYIAAQTGAAGVRVAECARLSGGAIQENYALTLELDGGDMPGRQEFVVRGDAASTITASLTRAQEFAVLRAAHAAGVAAPRPYWLCTDTAVAGVPFYVMARAYGTAAGRTLTGGALSPAQARALTRRLGAELARLHRVTPPAAGLEFLALPQPDPVRARTRAYREALAAVDTPQPALEWALGWLERHAPPSNGIVLVHGDFRTGNYLVRDGELAAILDWEFAAWSDPCEDLGWFCARSWRFAGRDREAGGIGDKRDLIEGYESAGGGRVDPHHVTYWEVMASVRWAVIALQQAGRHLSGEQPSLELALTGRMVPEIVYDMLRHIEDVEGRA